MDLKKVSLGIVFLFGMVSAYAQQQDKDRIVQISKFSEFSQGNYNGGVSCDQIKKYGDFGLGTFKGLDGEMIGFDDSFYQIRGENRVNPVNDLMSVSFALVKFFEVDRTVWAGRRIARYEDLEQYLESLLPQKNHFYAFKIKGVFNYIKTGLYENQDKSSVPLADLEKKQIVSQFYHEKGTIVGFRVPQYVQSISIPEYRFSFLADNKKNGGIILECEMESVVVEIDECSFLYLLMPENGRFYKVSCNVDQTVDLKEIGE